MYYWTLQIGLHIIAPYTKKIFTVEQLRNGTNNSPVNRVGKKKGKKTTVPATTERARESNTRVDRQRSPRRWQEAGRPAGGSRVSRLAEQTTAAVPPSISSRFAFLGETQPAVTRYCIIHGRVLGTATEQIGKEKCVVIIVHFRRTFFFRFGVVSRQYYCTIARRSRMKRFTTAVVQSVS